MSNETSSPAITAYSRAAILEVHDRRIRTVFTLIQNDPICSVGEPATKIHLSRQPQRLFKLQTGAHIGNFSAEQNLQRAAKRGRARSRRQ
jgi:hypothetical protein